MYSSIFLTGFRATGKTTLGKLVAERLGWNFVDSDTVIMERAGMSIYDLTEGGKNWKLFRQMELDLLREMMMQQNVVFAMGGGECVNNILKDEVQKTFGELGGELLKQATDVLVVLLTAQEKIISERIRAEELATEVPLRPVLDPARAEQLGQLEKGQLVNEIILDSLKKLRERLPTYKQLTRFEVDTSTLAPEECVDEVVKLL